jgi:serine/threonine protein kinase
MEIEELLSKLVNMSEDPEQELEIIESIGDGSYGFVFKAWHRKSGQMVAVKLIPVIDFDSLETCLKEMQILNSCSSKYIVSYYKSYYKNSQLWIVMEFCEAGSIKKIIQTMKRGLDEQTISALIYSILKGLEYIHKNRLIHRDIKADNILLDSNGCAKIADFGVSTKLISTYGCTNSVIGTPFWMSPEIISNHNYTSKTDIWSLGITAIEFAEKEPPYSNKYPWMVMQIIKSKPAKSLTDPSKWSDMFNDFVKRCLTVDPDERPTAEDLLQHPFVLFGQKNQKMLKKLVSKYQAFIDLSKMREQNQDNETHYDVGNGDNRSEINSPVANFNNRIVENNDRPSSHNRQNYSKDPQRPILNTLQSYEDSLNSSVKHGDDNAIDENGDYDNNQGTIVYHGTNHRMSESSQDSYDEMDTDFTEEQKKSQSKNHLQQIIKANQVPSKKFEMDKSVELAQELIEKMNLIRSRTKGQVDLDTSIGSINRKIDQYNAKRVSEIEIINKKYDDLISPMEEFLETKRDLMKLASKLAEMGFKFDVAEKQKSVEQLAKTQVNVSIEQKNSMPSFAQRNSGNSNPNGQFYNAGHPFNRKPSKIVPGIKKNNSSKNGIWLNNPKISDRTSEIKMPQGKSPYSGMNGNSKNEKRTEHSCSNNKVTKVSVVKVPINVNKFVNYHLKDIHK